METYCPPCDAIHSDDCPLSLPADIRALMSELQASYTRPLHTEFWG